MEFSRNWIKIARKKEEEDGWHVWHKNKTKCPEGSIPAETPNTTVSKQVTKALVILIVTFCMKFIEKLGCI